MEVQKAANYIPYRFFGSLVRKINGTNRKGICIASTLRYSVCVLIVAFCFSGTSNAQRWKLRRYEVGFGIGTTQVFGDIGGAATTKTWFGLKDIKIDETRLAFDVFGRYKISPRYSVKLNGILGFGSGDDEGSRNLRGRSYKTTLFELSTQFEYYFVTEENRFKSAAMFSKRGMINNYASFNAYGFVGLGAIYYRPKFSHSDDPDQWDENIDITTGYSNFAAVFPFGLGLKYIVDDHWLINAELGYRYTTSDFIDGYTQKLDSKHKDVYYFLTLSATYRLKTSRYGMPSIFERLFSKRIHTIKPSRATRIPKSEKEAKEEPK